VTKELCLVTLTRIYTLVHKYQTLVREIASPTLNAFATACLQALKPSGSGKAVNVPLRFTETVFEAFSTLIPLYPTTLRPFAGQIRAATRSYVAPTNSDEEFVPEGLQGSARRLVIRLHMTAAKNGGADEWAKHIGGVIKEFHQTADQVFRAVQENWESTTGYAHQPVNFDEEPKGGGSAPEQLPEWTGIQAGSERMIGLLAGIADCLRCGTKVPVSIPVSAITDLATRVSSIIPPVSGNSKQDSVQLNSAVGREEKDDLWAVFPDIQVASINLTLALMQRLGRNFIPLAQDTLDQMVRILDSGYRLPEIRRIVFKLTAEILRFCGPTMSKNSVDALQLMLMVCFRDLLGSAGHIKAPKRQAAANSQSVSKAKTASQNADAFLSSNAEEESAPVSLDPEHLAAAEQLLVAFFSQLPQQHINPDLRSRMLRTAILCRIRDAQVASVLRPARDRNGRTLQVILPHLHRQFPHDETVEVLRFNFRPLATGTRENGNGNILNDMDDEMQIDGDATSTEQLANGTSAFDRPFQVDLPQVDMVDEPVVARTAPSAPVIAAEAQLSPFLPQPIDNLSAAPSVVQSTSASINPLKRKSEEWVEPPVVKRLDMDAATTQDPGFESMGTLVESTLAQVSGAPVGEDDEDDEDDDESVHLNMDLDSDDEGDE
jgi:pre-rRNA-processing protein RIX1